MKMKIVLLIIIRLRARSPSGGSDRSDRTRTDDGAARSRPHLLCFFRLFGVNFCVASVSFFDQLFFSSKRLEASKISESDKQKKVEISKP